MKSLGRGLRSLFYRCLLAPPLTKFYDRFLPAKSLGNRGERAAERFLLCAGYIILERGYHDHSGEIDLIAVDNKCVVFVEVKTRTSDFAGDPTEAVDETKQRHLTQAAIGYLKWHQLTDCQVRFDVVSITWPDETKAPEIVHYLNAFEATGQFQMF